MSNVFVYVEDGDEVRVEPPDEFGRVAVQLGDSAFLRLHPAVAVELESALSVVNEGQP